jgi:alpha-glucosidase (family GH31 glycosyl hydrolase)
MPYLYTLAWQNHRTGIPLTRPLFFADPSDEQLHEAEHSYLFGESLLVAPVLRDSARRRTVPLPEGTWINYWTDEAVEGGRSVSVDAPLNQIPLFVKGGAILPMRPVAPHTAAQPADTLGLAVYPDSGRTGSFSLYEDDGRTLNYQDGAYAVTDLTQRLHPRSDGTADLSVSVGAAAGTYGGQPQARTVRARIHRVPRPPDRVQLNGRGVSRRVRPQGGPGWHYDSAANRLTVQFRGPIDEAHRLVVENLGPMGHF